MANQPVSRGRLTLNVAEASGRTNEDQVVWDQSFVEGFVKVEVRGEGKTVKVASRPRKIIAHSINWNEDLGLDVLEGAKELRLMLCREKRSETRTSTSVVAACGIFIEDIINAVPIDKYFELFKPGAAGPGGFIRISMNFDPTNITPYHSPEGFKSAHSAVSDTSYQDIPMGDGQIERLTPRDSNVNANGDDAGTAARRITAEAFEGGLGTENGEAPEYARSPAAEVATPAEVAPSAAPAETTEAAVEAPADELDEPDAGPAKHGLRWLLVAGILAAGAVAFSALSHRQKDAKK